MIKSILAILAFTALIQSSSQLNCYYCKSKDLPSRLNENMEVCPKDIKEYPIKSTGLDVKLVCKKIIEKVKANGKDEELIIRNTGPENMKLDESIFDEYSCSKDLCNAAASFAAPTAAFLSAVAVAAAYRKL